MLKLRSQEWFGRNDRQGYEHRGMMRALGLGDEAFSGKPIIGLCSVWSELNPCDLGLKDLAERARAGVIAAGGVPVLFPAPAIGEPLMRPSPMMYRNLVSMVVEETIRGNPLDGVVLLAGCDKSTPALLMGAFSVDIPAIMLSSGPRNSSRFKGDVIGGGTQIWRTEQAIAEGNWTQEDAAMSEAAMGASHGTCNTMGTASTMAAIVETLGLALPNNTSLGSTDARRATLAEQTGRRIVDAVLSDRKPSAFLTRTHFENAIRVVSALGGSTNAVPHLLAMAGRAEIDLSLEDWERFGDGVPCLVDLLPAGRYLMQDFDDAGGLSVVIKSLLEKGLLDGSTPMIEGSTLADRVQHASCWNAEVIRTFDNPVSTQGGLKVLRGNLCPDGAVMKPSAASPDLMQHRGRARVFDDIEAWKTIASDMNADIEATDIVVVRNSGPVGYPGMPEIGNVRIPDKLARQGVTDMVRLSDARMSGTAFGTVILHITPESAVGGPLGLVQDGDEIALDTEKGKLELLVDEAELERRRQAIGDAPSARAERGYESLYQKYVKQADSGADFTFLEGRSGSAAPRDST
ncbi:MAG: dihydroxy-acid dehydratase [Pseudomonadota bacterium]